MTASSPPERVIDVHVHVQPWEMLRPDVAGVMTRGRPDRDDIDRYIESPDAFIAFMDAERLARVALINYAAPEVMGFDHGVNPWVAAYRDRHPDRIIAFGGIHPATCADPRAEVEHLLDELRIDGVKVHPPHQLLHANDYDANGGALRTLYAACQERGVPIMVHTGTSIFPGARGKYGDPMDCDDVAVDFPELKLILAHGGRPLWMDTATHLVRRHRHVYMDLSGIPPQALLEYFPKLEAISGKCLFGTDWPSPGVRSIRANVDAVAALPISDEAKARIFHGNADALFPPRESA